MYERVSAPAAASRPVPGNPLAKVLIVDDEPAITMLLAETLKKEGYSCLECGSAQEALRLVDAQEFDIVLSDIRMPGMGGLELLRSSRLNHRQAAFVMVTGADEVSVCVQAMKEGAYDYLLKPPDLEAVRLSLRRVLERKRIEAELENYRLHLEEMVEQRTEQLQTALKQIERTYDETLEALGGALDLKDDSTAGHSRRVTLYCLKIADSMGCSDNQKKQLARGAYLHDLGKIGIPDAILLKPGKLTEEEAIAVQSHIRIGYELVNRIAFLAPAADIVLAHHERWDGTGHPRGLKADEIPLGARIFAVADALDAMTSDRPYRAALPFPVARAEIGIESGRQFDPRVVRAFLTLPDEVWQDIRNDSGPLGFLSVMSANIRLPHEIYAALE